jgi:hypothetical protein
MWRDGNDYFIRERRMAHLVPLKQPVQTAGGSMGIILNVGQTVGHPRRGGVNNFNDVQAVQALIDLYLAFGPAMQLGLPDVTGTFDSTTGYWIFEAQVALRKRFPSEIIDGIVSPAHDGMATYGTGAWTIIELNAGACSHAFDSWNSLCMQYANFPLGA